MKVEVPPASTGYHMVVPNPVCTTKWTQQILSPKTDVLESHIHSPVTAVKIIISSKQKII